MKDIIHQWFNSEEERISLFEEHDEIFLKRQGDTVLLHVQLALAQPGHGNLQLWARLGAASLNHFQGGLARDGNNGSLWLVQNLNVEDGVLKLIHCLEALLNQRDTWRATASRLTQPVYSRKPTSLRSLSY
ncbi:type III secretion protein [Pseudomonas reactans]|uniref:Type III secretion protein n=1 Tax=Pseudomonas reactans TaxID=117680 RepID=A0A7Y8KGW9_9PSED|nr:type III secretion protein [Pseudomonas reactans]